MFCRSSSRYCTPEKMSPPTVQYHHRSKISTRGPSILQEDDINKYRPWGVSSRRSPQFCNYIYNVQHYFVQVKTTSICLVEAPHDTAPTIKSKMHPLRHQTIKTTSRSTQYNLSLIRWQDITPSEALLKRLKHTQHTSTGLQGLDWYTMTAAKIVCKQPTNDNSSSQSHTNTRHMTDDEDRHCITVRSSRNNNRLADILCFRPLHKSKQNHT